MITGQSFSVLCGIRCVSLYCGNFLNIIHPHCGHFKKCNKTKVLSHVTQSFTFSAPCFTFALSPALIFALFFSSSFNFPSFSLHSIFLISITNVSASPPPKCLTVGLFLHTAHHLVFCLVFILNLHIHSRMEAENGFTCNKTDCSVSGLDQCVTTMHKTHRETTF